VDDAIPPERPAPQPPPPAPWQRPDQPPPGVPSTYPAAPGEATQTGQPQGWGQQGTTQWGQPTWGGPYGGAGQPGAPPPPGLPPGQPPGWGPGGWQQARPKPGIIPLRPISLLEIYDGAFQALRTNPRTMIGVSAVVIAITTLISAVPQAFGLVAFSRALLRDPGAAGASPQEIAAGVTGLASGFIIPAVIEWLAVTVVTGLLIVAVSAAVLGRAPLPACSGSGPAAGWPR
jgi:hypothetical protein